jgi:aryl-alcohol dehydrogenase-like predicted oxidoreductase
MISLAKQKITNTGLSISSLGLGTVKWGRNQAVKYPAFELPSDATLHQLLDVATAAGLNLLDTAPAYGIAEERVGQILRERAAADFVIMTKTGEEFIDGKSHHRFTKKHTEASIHRSLRRLNALTLDLVMVHCSADDVTVLEQTDVLETLYKLRDDGLIRALGVSTMTVAGGLRAVDLVDAVMVPFSVGYQDHLPVIQKAHALSKAVLVKRALYSGPAAESPLTLPQLLCPVLETPGVTAVMAGTINPRHLAENIQVAGASRLLRAV